MLNFFRIQPTATAAIKYATSRGIEESSDLLAIVEYVEAGQCRRIALLRLEGDWSGVLSAVPNGFNTYVNDLPYGILDWVRKAHVDANPMTHFLFPKDWIGFNAHLIKHEAFKCETTS